MKAIDDFLAGFQRFQKGEVGPDSELFAELRQGQSPKALLIGCSDSRVDPAILTDCAPGELFVVRNVANMVPPCDTDTGRHGVEAAVEFAVCHLRVDHIIVLGHSQCGGIKALMESEDRPDESSFIGRWVSLGAEAKDRVLREHPGKTPEEQRRACEETSVVLSLENLMTFPWVRQRVEDGTLTLHGWHFDLQAGTLSGYSRNSGNFELLS